MPCSFTIIVAELRVQGLLCCFKIIKQNYIVAYSELQSDKIQKESMLLVFLSLT